jgi:hypothetical protein
MNPDGTDLSDQAEVAGVLQEEPIVPEVAKSALEHGLATFDLTVLPNDTSQSGKFIYDEATADLVKELKAAGVNAGFAHSADDRLYYSERSADIAVAFLVNLGSAAVWEAFMMALESYRTRKKLTVTLVHDKTPDGTEHQAATFDGDGAKVLKAMRLYLDSQD